MYRTHTCNDLTDSDVDSKVKLSGWVHRRRDHGGLIFIDLRDRYGLTQIVFDPAEFQDAHEIANTVRSEYVITVEGTVRKRPEGMENQNINTGKIEVLINDITVLNKAATPPFEIDQDKEVGEEIRLKYRYLDIRRERMKKNLEMRYKILKEARNQLDKHNFIEVETPILIKGTPEGSREYLVPSRLYPGTFFVLPQSPQQLKQLLMVASMDRYFQIARCFRDEDQRGDRQPEFTQIDIEMSFVDQDDVMKVNEEMAINIIEKLYPNKKILAKPFPKLTYNEAMSKYGSDKPDLRFEMQIVDLTEEMKSSGFKVFADASKNGVVKALKVEKGADYTRKEIDDLTELAKVHGAKGLAYIQMTSEGPKSPILKFLAEEEIKSILEKTVAKTGDIIFFGADKFETACASLGQVRLACADKLSLRNKDELAFCWVTDFPLFEWDEDENRLAAVHHPFTSPNFDDIPKLDSKPEDVRSIAYDLAMNGSEIAGGSIRIHDPELQAKIFDLLGITKEDAEKRFGHLLEAFKYGTPPHGGIAWGFDRFVMILQDEPNIREVMAFPKDQKAKDIMLSAPSSLPAEQVAEANIKIIEKNSDK